VLDSACGFALTLDVDFLWQHYAAMPGAHISQSGSSVGFNTPVNSYTATFNDIEVLGRHFRHRMATYATSDVKGKTAGSIGTRLMAHGRFTFDYSSERMWVEWQTPPSAEEMLRRLGDPKGKDLSGRTPLMIAADEDREDVVSALLRRGADVNAKDGSECMALIYASSSRMMKLLLDAGADPNATVAWRSLAALHYAAMYGDAESVKILVKAGANVNGADTGGITPLMYACKSDYLDVVKALLDAGANPKSTAIDGNTALTYAAAWSELPMVEMLVKKGADVNLPGWTPLHAAAGAGRRDNVEFLLRHDARVNAVAGAHNETSLMLAATNGREEIVRLLLSRGADANLRSSDGKTALDYASDPNILRDIFVSLEHSGPESHASSGAK
jgi:ankyrin repeat protein